MKYYRKCQKILGNKVFEELSQILLDGIIKKFGTSISVEEFVEILEINIDAILMLGLASAFPGKRKSVLHGIDISSYYLITATIDEFETKLQDYIKLISEKI